MNPNINAFTPSMVKQPHKIFSPTQPIVAHKAPTPPQPVPVKAPSPAPGLNPKSTIFSPSAKPTSAPKQDAPKLNSTAESFIPGVTSGQGEVKAAPAYIPTSKEFTPKKEVIPQAQTFTN